MPEVRVKESEPFEGALRRFKRAVEKAGLPKELRLREHHTPKSALRQRNKAAARKRLLKKLARDRALFEKSSSGRGRGKSGKSGGR